jgi:hypothetical protein
LVRLAYKKARRREMDYAEVRNAAYVVLSVTGPYAGEGEDDIYARKVREIDTCGFTFWHHQSYQAKPDLVQRTGAQAEAEGQKLYLVIMRTGSNSAGVDTKKSNRATSYRGANYGPYEKMPEGIYVEVGRSPYALVLKGFTIMNEEIDLWDYSSYEDPGRAIVTRQGGSTVCAVKSFSGHNPEKMKSHVRKVVACAELISPYSVWLGCR